MIIRNYSEDEEKIRQTKFSIVECKRMRRRIEFCFLIQSALRELLSVRSNFLLLRKRFALKCQLVLGGHHKANIRNYKGSKSKTEIISTI